MSFLSSVRINPLRRGAQRLIQNPQAMHAAVEGVLPSGDRRILWRLETHGHEMELLIQSPEPPTLDHLIEQAGWPGAESGRPRVADMTALQRSLGIGRRFGFRAKLNPTSATRTPLNPTSNQEKRIEAGKRSIRVGQRTPAHQLDWFLKRAAQDTQQWGFIVHAADVTPVRVAAREKLRFQHPRSGPVALDVVTYEGELVVTDPELLWQRMQQGIGPAKAYGCGLITLAPVRS